MRLTPSRPAEHEAPTPITTNGPNMTGGTVTPHAVKDRGAATEHDSHRMPRPANADRRPVSRRRHRWLPGLASVALALMLTASAAPGHADTTHVLALAGTLDDVLNNIRNWIMGILAGIATVFLSIGGVRYVMAAGDPGEVEKAKTAFKSAAWGYGLAALAPLVVTALKGIVGA